jgi:hypothetical protein
MSLQNEWRKMQIILEPELVERLSGWHSGMDAVYALSSTGRQNLVSLSMIDAALDLLRRDGRKAKPGSKDRKDLAELVGDLESVRTYWREHSAKEAGMEDEDFVYRFDRQNYGMTPAEEAEILTTEKWIHTQRGR